MILSDEFVQVIMMEVIDYYFVVDFVDLKLKLIHFEEIDYYLEMLDDLMHWLDWCIEVGAMIEKGGHRKLMKFGED